MRACVLAAGARRRRDAGLNKSYREHSIVGSEPRGLSAPRPGQRARLEGRSPSTPINRLDTVDAFIDTYDSTRSRGRLHRQAAGATTCARRRAPPRAVGRWRFRHRRAFETTRAEVESIANKSSRRAGRGQHLPPRRRAQGRGQVYRRVSMDETDSQQTPPRTDGHPRGHRRRGDSGADGRAEVTGASTRARLRRRPARSSASSTTTSRSSRTPSGSTICPEPQAERHSGSDKFSIYGPISRALRRTGAGIHVKTAGTSWLEEVIGLPRAAARAAAAKEIRQGARRHRRPSARLRDRDRHRPRAAPSQEEVGVVSRSSSGAPARPGQPAIQPEPGQCCTSAQDRGKMATAI